jgi:hypothetical protein
MPKLLFIALTIMIATNSVAQTSSYVHRAVFMCLDGDTCNRMTAVENKYPESALFITVERISQEVNSITIGKDWSAREHPVSLYDTLIFRHELSDTAYFYDANNDGKQDILLRIENRGGNGINGQLDKWLLLLQGKHGSFEKLTVFQYGEPFYRRSRRNYWLSDRLEISEKLRSQYWVHDLYELRGDRFFNVGFRFGYPKLSEFVGKVPKRTKKLLKEITLPQPGLASE